MSEEEKAIELLKKLQKKTPYIIWGDGTPYNKSNQIQIILNVIDRQQKEIARLKEIIEKQQKEIEELKEKNKELDKENQGLFELYNFNDSSLLSKILKDYKKIIDTQQKEIEEKTTIIMAGAKKVKQLEKEIEELTLGLEEMTKSNNHKKENWVHKNILDSYISKDKIKELKEKVEKEMISNPYDFSYMINELLEENK